MFEKLIKSTKMKDRIRITLNIIFIAIFLNGCEDDPLLAPQSDNEEEGGSYGVLSLPGSEQPSDINNPETF